jgi:hypothetical protein
VAGNRYPASRLTEASWRLASDFSEGDQMAANLRASLQSQDVLVMKVYILPWKRDRGGVLGAPPWSSGETSNHRKRGLWS